MLMALSLCVAQYIVTNPCFVWRHLHDKLTKSFCVYLIIGCSGLPELPMEIYWIFETCYWVLGTSFHSSLYYRVYSVCRVLESTRRTFVYVTWHSAALLARAQQHIAIHTQNSFDKGDDKTRICDNVLYHNKGSTHGHWSRDTHPLPICMFPLSITQGVSNNIQHKRAQRRKE